MHCNNAVGKTIEIIMRVEKVKVRDISSQVRGVSYSPKDVSETLQRDYFPVLRANNITENGLYFEDLVYINKKNVSENQLLQNGDIVIAASSGSKHIVGKAAIFENNWTGSFGAFCKVIRPSNKVFSKYLGYYFQSDEYRKKISHLSAGANINNIRTGDIDNLELFLPSLSVQKRIVVILEQADVLRKKDQQLLTQYDALLQSIFYDMFGDPVTNEKEWEIKLLISCVEMKGGGTPNTSNEGYYNGHIPWVSPKDMKMRFVNDSIDKITEVAIKESSTKLIEANSVLLVVRSGILKNSLPIAINTVPVAINQDMKALKCLAGVNPVFLMFQLESLASQILQTVRGTTADNISSDVLKKVEIILPPVKSQKQFSDIALNIELQKQKVRQQLKQSEALFQTLLQKAFNGDLIKE